MKTTLEIPDSIFRKAKAKAALCGIPFRQLVTEALAADLSEEKSVPSAKTSPPWMKGFGQLADLHEETNRINDLIRSEFQHLEPEDRL